VIGVSNAWRQFRNDPLAHTMAALAQAVGIGGTIVVFALVVGVRERRPSGVDASGDDLVQLRRIEASSSFFAPSLDWFPYPEYLALQQEGVSYSNLAASMGMQRVAVTIHGQTEGLMAGLSSSSYLRVLGVVPVSGRGFAEDEERPGGDPVCLIRERLARRWAIEKAVPGAVLLANGRPTTVVGVLPDSFDGTNYTDKAEIWFPLGQHDMVFPDGRLLEEDRAPFQLVARLKPGVPPWRAEEEATAIVRRRAQSRGRGETGDSVLVEPLLAYGYVERWQLWPIYAGLSLAAFLVLGMAVLNVTGLGMALALRRQRDVAIRLSLGASPRRIMIERLSERLGIGLVAGGLGLLLANAALGLLAATVSNPILRGLLDAASMLNWQMPVFVLAMSMLASIVSGILPAWSAARTTPMLVLRGEDWTRRRVLGIRAGLLVGQTAVVALLALTGAASARSLWKAQTASPGFDRRGLALAHIEPAPLGRDPGVVAPSLAVRLMRRLNARANVQATLSRLPVVNPSTVITRATFGRAGADGPVTMGIVGHDEVAPNYFDVLGIPILAGRVFHEADVRASAPLIVVNRSAAQRWLNGESIGSLVKLESDGVERVVIGVVGDVSNRGGLQPPEPFAYLPLIQGPRPSPFEQFGLTLHVRSPGRLDTDALVRDAARSFAPDLQVDRLHPIASVISDSLPLQRALGRVNLLFAAIALLVCATGFYATTVQIAAERQRELGVRMALGASPFDVAFPIARRWLASAAVGLAAGVGLGVLVVSGIERHQHVVLTLDVVTVGTVCVGIAVVSLAAVYFPVWRALRSDPATTLRLPSETS
jgi:putative ABC transport system permease protein